MNHDSRKVTADHLARRAFLYVRQSTLRQVMENTESTRRQYDLRARAQALGWPPESITVIDSDLGQSGADRDRDGFNRLVGEVTMGNAGIVLGLEVSRLARNSSDWHRLLELCAMTGTLILDEDGLYDPRGFNDRLILGLKGQMSEAELHFLRARLLGGIMSRARRGELKLPLPIGFVYDPLGKVALDPDAQVRGTISLLFDTFWRTGSATATVKAFRRERLLFPRRPRTGPRSSGAVWDDLTHSKVLEILHNPRYAGAFMYGRTLSRRRPDGTIAYRTVPLDEVEVLLRGQHEGYITWERFEANRRRLAENSRCSGTRRPPREGQALLQGIVICGKCGDAMTVRYGTRRDRLVPVYMCQRRAVEQATRACQHVPGAGIDRAVGDLIAELMKPAALEAALLVQGELEARDREIDAWHGQRVQRAREEAEIARTRFMNVHPENRIVADVLESEWNRKLGVLDDVRQECDRRRAEDRGGLADRERERILGLAGDFPKLWNDPQVPDRERKRMVRLLVEDVTITRGSVIEMGIRLKGGAVRELTVAPELRSCELHVTPPETVSAVDELLEEFCDGEVAERLNQRGLRTGYGKPFNLRRVQRVRRAHGLKTRYRRLRERGLLTGKELAERLGVAASTIKLWRQRGLLEAVPWNERNECLYEMPDNPPVKHGHKFRRRAAADERDRSDDGLAPADADHIMATAGSARPGCPGPETESASGPAQRSAV